MGVPARTVSLLAVRKTTCSGGSSGERLIELFESDAQREGSELLCLDDVDGHAEGSDRGPDPVDVGVGHPQDAADYKRW
jgi:hypothetical protein